jgi:hypothetical protein
LQKLRQAPASEPATNSSAAALVRARQAQTAEAYDLVASLFPDMPEAEEARAAAVRLRELTVLDSAGPTFEGRELVQMIQGTIAAARLHDRRTQRRVRGGDHSGFAPRLVAVG